MYKVDYLRGLCRLTTIKITSLLDLNTLQVKLL